MRNGWNLDAFRQVAGREEYRELIRRACGGHKSKKRSDDAIAMKRIDFLERKLPECLRQQVGGFQVHRLSIGPCPGRGHRAWEWV